MCFFTFYKTSGANMWTVKTCQPSVIFVSVRKTIGDDSAIFVCVRKTTSDRSVPFVCVLKVAVHCWIITRMPQLSRASLKLTISASDTKCAPHFPLQFLSRTFFASTNISRVMLEIRVAKAYKSSRNVSLFFFLRFQPNFGRTPKYKNSWKILFNSSRIFFMRTDGRTEQL